MSSQPEVLSARKPRSERRLQRSARRFWLRELCGHGLSRVPQTFVLVPRSRNFSNLITALEKYFSSSAWTFLPPEVIESPASGAVRAGGGAPSYLLPIIRRLFIASPSQAPPQSPRLGF